MGFPRATALFTLALFAAASRMASAGVLGGLPIPITVMPAGCGFVVQVQSGDTCQKLADFGDISLAQYGQLNPLALCGILIPAPGSLTCVGDTLAFCEDFYRTRAGDTCDSISLTLGTVLRVGLLGGTCTSLPTDTPVCVRPTANACDVDNLCGTALDQGIKDMLGLVPDWCTVLSTNCQVPLVPTVVSGLPSFLATITDVTPAISAVAGNPGHPELREFVAQRAAGPRQLQVAFTPNAGGVGKHTISFTISAGSSGRKLLYVPPRQGSYYASRY